VAIERTVNVADARANLAELTSKAYFDGDRFIVQRRGVPVAVLLGIDDYRELVRVRDLSSDHLQRERRRLAQEMDAIRQRIGPLPFTVADLVNAARVENEERYAQPHSR